MDFKKLATDANAIMQAVKGASLDAQAGTTQVGFSTKPPKDFTDYWWNYKELDKSAWNQDRGYALGIVAVQSNGEEKLVAKYDFPINPSNINFDTPAASTIEATMKGVTGTDNGAPLRRISLAGTTGVLPVLSSIKPTKSTTGSPNLDHLFKNTIKSFNLAVSNAKKILGTDHKSPLNKNVSYTDSSPTADQHQTGFSKIHDLKRFIDYYLAGKKLNQNKNWRLVFYAYKDQDKYYCILNSFGVQKGAGTIEYGYSIQLTSWRRADVKGGNTKKPLAFSRDKGNDVQKAISSLIQARRTLASFLDVMSGIRADIHDSFVVPVGELVLLLKDSSNAAFALGDFAFSGDIIKTTAASLKSYYADNQAPFLDAAAKIKERGFISSINSNNTSNSALSDSVNSKINDQRAADFVSPEDTADPFQAVLDNPTRYPEIFDDAPIDALGISDSVQASIDSIIDGVRGLEAEDLISRRDTILNFAASISEGLGGGDATYNRVMGQNTPKKTFKKLTTEDIMILNEINNIVIAYDTMIALMDEYESKERDDFYTFYRDFSISNGIDFSPANVSKFYIPFPYGSTLDQLALQYLGSPDLWVEIAALNGLKAPYVDEEGIKVKVTASSGGNTLTVSSSQYFYIGQIVEIGSDSKVPTIRKVREIDVVNEAQTLITFNESKTLLTQYKVSDNAYIKVFQPNTVNSNMLIAIPSEDVPRQDSPYRVTPDIADLDKLARIAKIDFMLDTQGDYIITGNGDLQLATGLTNIVQAATLKLRTSTQSLLQDPTFGNPAQVGVNTSEADANDTVKSLNESFSSDPRFEGIVGVKVNKSGPTITIDSLVNIASTDISLPISAELPKIQD